MTFFILNCVIVAFIFAKGLRRGPQSIFHFLASSMIVIFFLIPSFWFTHSEHYLYLGQRWEFSQGDFLFTQHCLFIFLVGYIAQDCLLARDEPIALLRQEGENVKRRGGNRVVYFLLAPMVLLIALFIIFSESADIMIAMRRGEVATSPLYALMISTTSLLAASLLFFADARRNTILALFVMPILIITTASFGGRMAFAGTLALCLGYFRVPLRLSIAITLLASPILVPLAINGKAIIYAVVGGYDLSEIVQILSYDVDVTAFVENHLGHPVVSLDNVNQVIDILGYRFFYDYIQGFLFYFRIFGLPVDGSLTYYNTLVLTGEFRSQIPTGFLAFGYVQAGFFGVFISGSFYRLLGRLAAYIYKRIGVQSRLLSFYLAMISANAFYTGEVRTLVINLLFPFLFLTATFWFMKLR